MYIYLYISITNRSVLHAKQVQLIKVLSLSQILSWFCCFHGHNLRQDVKWVDCHLSELTTNILPLFINLQRLHPVADRIFPNTGGHKRLCTCSQVPWSGSRALKRVLDGSSRVLDALSCYLSIILKYSDTKRYTENKFTNIADQNWEGTRACCGRL